MWILALNRLAWVSYTAIPGKWKFLLAQQRTLRDAVPVTLVDLYVVKGLPNQTKHNGVRRIAYTKRAVTAR